MLIKSIIAEHEDVVYGGRFRRGNAVRVLYNWHRVGSLVITELTNMFINLNLTDMGICFKVLRKLVKNIIFLGYTSQNLFFWKCV